jgi:hypothetical protein
MFEQTSTVDKHLFGAVYEAGGSVGLTKSDTNPHIYYRVVSGSTTLVNSKPDKSSSEIYGRV